MRVTLHSHRRRTLYHSAKTPGYTCWSGLWRAADRSLNVTFVEARGPVDGWRPRAPASVLRRMPKANQEIPGYDMTGVAMENVTLRSTDQGRTWRKVHVEPFASVLNGFCNGFVTLEDGTLLRDLWGQSLTTSDLPATGLLQRSRDNGRTWEPPTLLSPDPRLQTWPKRLRRLRDGRVFLTGAASPYDPATWTWEAQAPTIRPCFWISRDPSATVWSEPVYLAPPGPDEVGEEWDVAELENGDLLAVLRTATFDRAGTYLRQQRRQCLLTRRGSTWEPGPIVPAPFAHAGHPEVMATREGVVLHIAANGIWWTDDRGATWTQLDAPGTHYYPVALQREDGLILAVSHVGSDDPYGKVDQSIVLDTFRLTVRR